MKRSFFRKRNSLLGSGGVGPYALGVGVFILLLLGVRFLIPGTLTALSTPLWQLGSVSTAASTNISALFSDRAKLIQARDALQTQNAALVTENRMLLEKANDIQKLVGTSTPEGGRVAAGVLARPPVSPYDTLVVNAGEVGQIRVGARVYGPGDVPLGAVASVSGTSATITLYSASGRVNDGWAGENRIPVTLTGAGAGAFRATVAREAGIQMGDIVYLPGPGALPVGRVVHVDTDPSSPKAVLQIQPAINIFSLTWVAIATNAS